MRSIQKTNAHLIASIAIFLAIAIGCVQPPQAPRYVGAGDDTRRNGGTLRFAEESNVHTLDPHYAYDTLSTAACRLMYDGLLDYDYDAKIVPSLAASFPAIAPDGKLYRFELRKGVKFHDGTELTAHDVSWSMHRLLSERIGSPGYPFYKSIIGAPAYHEGKTEAVEGIKVVDDYTIEFHLAEPDHTFLNAMAMPFSYPMPRDYTQKLEAEKGKSAVGLEPIGAGPFRMVRWERGVQLEYERFDDYWDPKPRVDRIIYSYNVSNHIAGARLRNGDIDIHYGPGRTDELFFRSSKAWAPYRMEFAEPSIFGIGLNCELSPFDNIHIRRAFSFAINREKIRAFNPTRYSIADQILPPLIPGHDPELKERQFYDLARAKEEMKLAGHPNGLTDPVVLWVRGDSDAKLAQLMQEDLKAIGVEIKLKQVSFATYLQETGKPRVAQAAFTGWHADFPDPSNFMDILFHSRAIHPTNSENRSFYRNATLDRILDNARTLSDAEARAEIYAQASNILARDTPWVYLFYPTGSAVWQPYVHNVKTHPVWTRHYRDLWLDVPRRKNPNAKAAQ